ncbi:MAG: dephospho-CoA kinase [Chloracidobacterium sp.]|nr:dephospho-CoA kinase [Chloracidobacterium sp.]
MLKVGLTGSIAVGKSYVCECFRELGCHVLDADKTARDVVGPGTSGLVQIVREFGSDFLQPNGHLDRKALANLVFADDDKRQLLNSIVHPLVIEEQDGWIRALERDDAHGIAIVDAALMIESGSYRRFDKIVVVWCEPAIQLSRLMARDNLSESEAKQRIAAQMSQEEKKSFADHLINTSADVEDVRRQVARVFEQLWANST